MSHSAESSQSGTLSRLPTFITVHELARLMRVNRNTVYEACARGDIPGVTRLGTTIRITREIVVAWLRGQGRGTRSSKG